MKDILERVKHPNLAVVVFSEAVILNSPIEEWPICDCLLAFFSMGFPLKKAIAYSKLRKPFLINDLESQYDLLNRFVRIFSIACVVLWVLKLGPWQKRGMIVFV